MDPRFFSFALLVVALFSYLSVLVWSRERRKEREAYYQNDTLKRIAETQGTGSSAMLEVLREEEKIATHRRRETQKVTGLVTIAAGVGVTIFLKAVDRHDPDPAYVMGVIPILVGVAFLLYAYVLAGRE